MPPEINSGRMHKSTIAKTISGYSAPKSAKAMDIADIAVQTTLQTMHEYRMVPENRIKFNAP